jgi:hypothetical protein
MNFLARGKVLVFADLSAANATRQAAAATLPKPQQGISVHCRTERRELELL